MTGDPTATDIPGQLSSAGSLRGWIPPTSNRRVRYIGRQDGTANSLPGNCSTIFQLEADVVPPDLEFASDDLSQSLFGLDQALPLLAEICQVWDQKRPLRSVQPDLSAKFLDYHA